MSFNQLTDLVKRNRAIDINPPPSESDINLTSHGSDWLWAAFSVFALLAICHGFVYSLYSVRKSGLKKSLLTIPLFTNAVMAFAYYTYASNLGYTWIHTEFEHVSTDRGLFVRQIFYTKFVGWFLCWPLVLVIFTVTTHVSLTDDREDILKKIVQIFSAIFTRFLSIEVFVLGLLIGALIRSTYKWGYFTFATVALLFTIYLICVDLHRSFQSVNKSMIANLVIIFEIVVWILYPICWGLSEGGNVIQPDSEAVFYGILDLINFGFVPVILTWIAINTVDEDFFTKVWHFHLNNNVAPHTEPDAEKSVGETTPRHSGDTAVAPAGVPQQEEEEQQV
ncbi:HSP31 [Candida metapsilosis]|uniref:HSP31 n=1 Tax=Candida metapsilosis TaxID=273372 RepID=A0A8H7ZLL5_9ASCO|nr:HSP31 [Candida metapsilosis]